MESTAETPAQHVVRRLRHSMRLVCMAALLLLGSGVFPFAGATAAPKRVLIVQSFGREIAPYDVVTASFRHELASRSSEPVVFLEAVLDAGRAVGAEEEAAFVAYLKARFAQPPPDLVVGVGPAAGRFMLLYRETLFPTVPTVLTGLDARLAPRGALKPGDALVATSLDLSRVFQNILSLRPQTKTIAVVLGASPIEHYWRTVLERESAPLSDRVAMQWYDQLTLAEMKRRIAALPPDSAVLYGLLIVDGAGVPQERLDALAELGQAAKVPIFSAFANELGRGVVGGPHLAETRAGREAAQAALRSLSGQPATEPLVMTIGMESPAYDWRELRRWQIDESRLPPGSDVRYREPPVWIEHRKEIIVVAVVVVAQALGIAALLVQRARRRRAEREARTLGGRLITAYEDEGRRLARELHDDVTQRLAGVSIEAATLGRLAEPAARAAAEQSISGELANLSRDVHAMSYRLHPSVIDDLGLEEALRVECGRLSRRGGVGVDFETEGANSELRGGSALCLFRVAQESLRNSERHARATRIRVKLHTERDGTELSVVDDGCGFDPSAQRERPSLGLASMRERVALLGGRLRIHSGPGRGTSVIAWIPSTGAA